MCLIHKWNDWKVVEKRITGIIYIKQSRTCQRCNFIKFKNQYYTEEPVMVQ